MHWPLNSAITAERLYQLRLQLFQENVLDVERKICQVQNSAATAVQSFSWIGIRERSRAVNRNATDSLSLFASGIGSNPSDSVWKNRADYMADYSSSAFVVLPCPIEYFFGEFY